jgi:G3E family GTPase
VTDRVPVTLLTGFLGSGKTTLLRELLRSPQMSDAAVIVNEMGEVGLDHLLLEKGAEDVVLLDSGCLCCTASNGLAETLEDLHYRRLRKEIPQFRRVVIETSGLAEPAPIMHLLLAEPAIVRWYLLDGVVTTVDTLHGVEQLAAHETSRRQAAVADVLILTKTDVASMQDVARMEQALDRINVRATRIRAAQGDVDSGHLTGLGRHDANGMTRWLRASGPSGSMDHRHPTDIATFDVEFDGPLSWSEYADWVASLRRLPAAQLLRVKGIVAIGPESRPHVVQGVQHVLGHPAVMAAWPWPDERSRLVFIVQGLTRDDVTKALAGPAHPT